MVILYSGSGANDFEIGPPAPEHAAYPTLRMNVLKLLRVRNGTRACALLLDYPFSLFDATNHFDDEFRVLYAVVPLSKYEESRRSSAVPGDRTAFRQIADTFAEIGSHVRFIAVGLQMQPAERPVVPGLTNAEINKLVRKYIGVNQGYLGDFSYQQHHDFYVDLDLDIDPYRYQGTTRERFEQILKDSTPDVQSRIVQGILDRYPPDSSPERQKLYAEVRAWITRLRTGGGVLPPDPATTSEVVRRALADAENLIRSSGATSAVDRVHTALHGYLLHVCKEARLSPPPDASLARLLKVIRQGHPALTASGPRSEEIARLLNSLGSGLDALNPIRNQASVAHPNLALLAEPEAMFVVNAARTILTYIDARLAA